MDQRSFSQMSVFAETILHNKWYTHDKGNGNRETWPEVANRVAQSVVKPYLPEMTDRIRKLIEERKFIPGGRYLYACGRKKNYISNCCLFKVADSKEGWGKTAYDCCCSLMSGAGVGVVYSDLRGEGYIIEGLGGLSSGPCALMDIINEMGRNTMQGGSRRSAIWAGLLWSHPDIFKFIPMKDWSEDIRWCRNRNPDFPCPMECTNISVILDNEFFDAFKDERHLKHSLAQSVYWKTVSNMLRTGEPGFSIDVGDSTGESLRNACTEVCSSDDGDQCNLGSINLARVRDINEFVEIVELSTAFLLCGSVYGKLPTLEMYKVREKNRRLGLGLMGVHEWLLMRGKRYEEDEELQQWMEEYARSDAYAHRYADRLSVSRPVATRAIAPTGSIAIIGETTSGIEPIFAAAYKRRYSNAGNGREHRMQYVIDATAQRIIDRGVDPSLIEDSYTLAEDYERRVQFQTWIQKHVDMSISSTINLPEWGSSLNNESRVQSFGERLFKYLPFLRGITAYPSGSRGGQPLTRVSYQEAVRYVGTEFAEVAENEDTCKGGVCGS